MTKQEFEAIEAPPTRPEALECCGTGCSPCIFDYYYQSLDKWEERNMPLKEYLALSKEFS